MLGPGGRGSPAGRTAAQRKRTRSERHVKCSLIAAAEHQEGRRRGWGGAASRPPRKRETRRLPGTRGADVSAKQLLQAGRQRGPVAEMLRSQLVQLPSPPRLEVNTEKCQH